MSEEPKPLLSIGDDGIKMNLKKGDSIKINATKSFMKGVEQNVAGGNLEHRATEELTQINNKMEASDGGKILNEVEGGKLFQKDNTMRATKKGTIVNRVTGKVKIAVWILAVTATVGFLADVVSLYLFGVHIWSKII